MKAAEMVVMLRGSFNLIPTFFAGYPYIWDSYLDVLYSAGCNREVRPFLISLLDMIFKVMYFWYSRIDMIKT